MKIVKNKKRYFYVKESSLSDLSEIGKDFFCYGAYE